MEPINLDDYEALARERLSRAVWDTYAQGSEDERTLCANRAAYDELWLRPRVLVDVRSCDTGTTALGSSIALPVMIAPVSVHQLVHPEGECATVQASRAAGTIMVASTLSSCSLEEIAQAAGGGTLWFQLYLYHDWQLNERLVKRAEEAGYRAIVLTVDAPYVGNRERDRRNAFCLPDELGFGNFAGPIGPTGPIGANRNAGTASQQITWQTRGEREMLTWDVIDWLRARTSLPLVLKGIVTAEDAAMAAAAGVDGIIVSNHGGRQLDGTVPTIAALPEVLEAVHGRCEVYVDGGIRRGTDVLKALALGARAVLVGRPVIWGLAAGGAAGVRDVLHILQTELALGMRLAGRTHVQSVDRSLIVSHAQWMGALAHATGTGRSADPDRRPTYSSALAEASRRRQRAHSSQRKVVRRARR